MLCISKSISWVLRIPVLSVSCHEAVTLVIKPCALIPDLVHMCCTLVFGMLCHPSHGTDCPNVGRSCDSHWDLIACIIGYLNSDLTEICQVCTKVLERDKVTLDLLRRIIECWPNRLFRLRLGREQRWLPLHFRTSLYLGQQCDKLGIPKSKDGCTFSGRIRIHGASSNRTPMRLAQELQRGDRIPIYSSHDNLCGQPSCDFLSN